MSSTLNSVGTKDVGTSLTSVYSVSGGLTGIAIGANIANTSLVTIFVDIVLRKSGVDYYLIKQLPIPPAGAYIWSGADQKICVDSTDAFMVKSSVAASCDVVVSVSEIA